MKDDLPRAREELEIAFVADIGNGRLHNVERILLHAPSGFVKAVNVKSAAEKCDEIQLRLMGFRGSISSQIFGKVIKAADKEVLEEAIGIMNSDCYKEARKCIQEELKIWGAKKKEIGPYTSSLGEDARRISI
jgi:hypothetical protein